MEPGTVKRTVAKGVLLNTAILFCTGMIPIFGFFFALLLPLSILCQRIRLGKRTGAIVLALSVGVLVLFFGATSFDGLFFIELMVLGYVLGEAFDRRYPIEKTFLFTDGIVLGSGLGVLMVYGVFSGAGFGEMISGYVARNLEATVSIYENVGMPEETMNAVKASMDQIRNVLTHILPSLAVSSVMFITWITVLLVRPICHRWKLPAPEIGALKVWRAPEGLVWGVIACGVMLMFLKGNGRLLAVNGLIFFMTIYFFSGMAIVSFYFDKKRFPMAMRVMIYVLIGLQQVLLLVVIVIGFFDMWLNFRKLEISQK